MWLELARRFVMIVLSVAIATGFMAHAAQSKPYHDQVAAFATIAGNHLTTGARDGCAGDQNVKVQVACFVTCGAVGALPPPAVIFNTVDAEILSPSVDLAMIDHTIPPDPYPPKSSDLN